MTARSFDDVAGASEGVETLGLIARGGMAEVSFARIPAVREIVALKRLRPEIAEDPRAVAMFRDEVRIGALFRHPNVVEVLEAGEDGGAPFLAMRYVPGEELSALCRRAAAEGRRPSWREALEVGRQAAAALAHVHEACDEGGPLEVVHGDVSPPNLLVTADGDVVLIDFGVARARFTAHRAGGAAAGKLAYMAPEQAAGGEPGAPADVFALGVIAWELAAGARLFRGPRQEVITRLLEGDVPPLARAAPGCPAAFESAVMAALSPSPADRPSARELEGALAQAGEVTGPAVLSEFLGGTPPAVDGGGHTEPPPRQPSQASEPSSGGRAAEAPPWLLVASGAALAAAAFGLLALWWM